MTLLVDLSTPLVMGILLGGLYAVIALGLSLVFGVVREINIAHGDLVILGSYFGYVAMTSIGIDPVLGLIGGIPLLFGLGFAIQKRAAAQDRKAAHLMGINTDQVYAYTFGIAIASRAISPYSVWAAAHVSGPCVKTTM